MERLVGHAGPDAPADFLLQELQAGGEQAEGVDRPAATLGVGAGDVGVVTLVRGPRVEEQRLGGRPRRTAAVAHVVERGGVRAGGDDVLVGRLGVVLRGRPQVEEVQVELARVGVQERGAARTVIENMTSLAVDQRARLLVGLRSQ